MLALEDRQSEDAKNGERCNLHEDQDGVETRALLGADDEKDSNKSGDHRCRKIEDAAAEGTRRERRRNNDTPAFHQADEITRPSDRNRAGANRIFEDQRPTDHPGEQFAHHRIGVGVSGSSDGNHRGKLGIAERRDRADEARDHEAEHHRRASLLRGLRGQHEDPGADDRADPEQSQLKRPK
jgi:hypothetical protein